MIEAKVVEALSPIAPVYPVKLPQECAYPAMSYFVVADTPKQCYAGDFSHKETRVQVDIWAKGYKEAKLLKERALDALRSIGASDFLVVDGYEEDVALYRQMIDFKLHE